MYFWRRAARKDKAPAHASPTQSHEDHGGFSDSHAEGRREIYSRYTIPTNNFETAHALAAHAY